MYVPVSPSTEERCYLGIFPCSPVSQMFLLPFSSLDRQEDGCPQNHTDPVPCCFPLCSHGCWLRCGSPHSLAPGCIFILMAQRSMPSP